MIFLILKILSSCHKNVSQSFLAAPARGGLAYNLHPKLSSFAFPCEARAAG